MAIRYDKDGKIATITINRPEAMNAMDRETSRRARRGLSGFRPGRPAAGRHPHRRGRQGIFCRGRLEKNVRARRGRQHPRDLGSRATVAPGAASARLETGDRRHQWLLSGRWAGARHGLRHSHRLRDRLLRMSRSALGHSPRLRGLALAEDDPAVSSHGTAAHRGPSSAPRRPIGWVSSAGWCHRQSCCRRRINWRRRSAPTDRWRSVSPKSWPGAAWRRRSKKRYVSTPPLEPWCVPARMPARGHALSPRSASRSLKGARRCSPLPGSSFFTTSPAPSRT